MPNNDPQLRVGAHVLVQLGSELVTDVEQAILEGVKNAYDADSPGCIIEIDTKDIKTLVEKNEAGRLKRFTEATDTVKVSFHDASGRLINPNAVGDNKQIERQLECTGRITIEDHGAGMSPEQLQSSWLVISQSAKRSETAGAKAKTKGGRTPLGDKGLGRLGSMKLGDVLMVESATSASNPIYSAQFRWADCDVATTVDEIPVFLSQSENTERFKGTKVSVLGLRDIEEWRRSNRVYDLARSLAKLISPFESKSTFPVKLVLDGADTSLDRVTEDTLKQAIAEFHFKWDGSILVAEAKFKKRLFTSKRTKKLKARTDLVFGSDDGAAFAKFLPDHRRIKGRYKDYFNVDLNGRWFVELKDQTEWPDVQPDAGSAIEDPGPFSGAFYFFHLDAADEEDGTATSGMAIDKDLIKSMSGISILRDGFRIRSQGDWLDISAGMTSGSTYNMRVDNTLGYFALTGEENYKLIEKSDREGFVEDAAYRGFLRIAETARNFANEALEQIRRSLDDYVRDEIPKTASVAATTEGSMQVVEDNLRSAREAKATALVVVTELQKEIDDIAKSPGDAASQKATSKAISVANSAIKAIQNVTKNLADGAFPEEDLKRIRSEFEEGSERAKYLLESAAVGLSARGLAHELRTHITEIKQRTTALERIGKRKGADPEILASMKAIRSSCNAIIGAAGLIDPMLPRTRAVKEEIDLRKIIEDYLTSRRGTLDAAGIKTSISGASRIVRANRSRLIQVIDNLVRNSRYWLRRGEATGKVKRPKKIEFRLVEYGFVQYDSGPGVDPKYEESLFDMFVTGKPVRDGGQGLGLFITQQILQIDDCDIALLQERNEDDRRYKFSVKLTPLIKG